MREYKVSKLWKLVCFVLPKFLVSSYNVTTALGIKPIKSLTVANVADTIGPPYKESVFENGNRVSGF